MVFYIFSFRVYFFGEGRDFEVICVLFYVGGNFIKVWLGGIMRFSFLGRVFI